MNLTKLREQSNFDWESAILKNFKVYKDNITWGDQDLINIVFHNRPGEPLVTWKILDFGSEFWFWVNIIVTDMVYLLPCQFNFRPDHCQYGLNCESPRAGDVQIIHGSRSTFFTNKNFPLFVKLYQSFEKVFLRVMSKNISYSNSQQQICRIMYNVQY